MMRRRSECRLANQQGAVLLVLAVVLSVVTLGWLYGRMASRHAADQVSASSLALAQTALIGRAVADANHPGSLPCPDTDNSGKAQSTVGMPNGDCPSYIGRLPWRTLGLSDIRDGNGERLWYALSSDARDYQYLAVNSVQTAGTLQVNNSGHRLAVLFAPGVAIAPQQRDVAHEDSAGNYLEGDNANGDNVYTAQAFATSGFNDRVLAVSSAQLFRNVERLVVQQIGKNLTQYAALNHVYPYAGNAPGYAQPNLLNGYIPYQTLMFSATDALVSNGWFAALAAPPLFPYAVNSAQSMVQINLVYCHGSMTLNRPMVVQCA